MATAPKVRTPSDLFENGKDALGKCTANGLIQRSAGANGRKRCCTQKRTGRLLLSDGQIYMQNPIFSGPEMGKLKWVS